VLAFVPVFVVVVMVLVGAVVVPVDNTLFGFAFMMPVGDAFIGPWLIPPAGDPPAPGGPPCPPPWPCAKAGVATMIAAAATNDLYDMICLRRKI